MEQSQRPPVHKWVVAGTVLTGTIMAVLDASIVNVALPSMTGTFGASVEEITWVVTGYMLAQVIMMPVTAFLSARFGRRNFYLFSLALFTLASMLCGVSRTLPVMVVFRILQGAASGVLTIVSQAILRESFPPEEQAMAMGMYGLGVVVAPAIGPTLGGWITDRFTWPWVFYVNLPIGLLSLIMVSRFIHDPPYLIRKKGRMDLTGVAFLAVGLGALQLLLEQGQRNDWFASNYITTLGAVALSGLVLFIWWELRSPDPAVNLRLLKNVSFTSATALGAVLGAGLFGTLFLLPMFLQRLLGYTALLSGAALVPRSLAMAVVMPLGGRIYNRLGPRTLVGAGFVVSAYSFWELSHLTSSTGFWDIFWPQMWQGVGFGLIFLSLSTAALAEIPKPDMTQAAGLYNVVRQVFGSVGIAVYASILTHSTTKYHSILSEKITPFSLPTQQFVHGASARMMQTGADAGVAHTMALKFLDLRVFQQAAVLAYNHVFGIATAIFVVAFPLVFLLKNPSFVGRKNGPVPPPSVE
jgi:DHA2 family multidrug resistance protein